MCSGPDLSTYLKIHKTLSEKEAKLIASQILSGLYYLIVDKKIIHYDMKPQNILFHHGLTKISDFGLSKRFNDHNQKIELTSQGVGTYWYLPPECFISDSKIDAKVDVWSLGVIFYEMLYGKKPFGNQMTQERVLNEGAILNAKRIDFPNLPVISIECKDFLRKCLEHNPDKRISIQDAYFSDYIRK